MAEPTQATSPQPSGHGKLDVYLNYLRWIEADGPLPAAGIQFDVDTTLHWFCRTLPQRPLLPALKVRYGKLADADGMLFGFPMERTLVEKVLIPLHQAKVAFIMGHELGCIALSGTVAEMLAVLRFQVSRFGTGSTRLSKGRQVRLFGREFEGLEHSRRIGVLELLGLIDSATAEQFIRLAKIRNAYLHRLSQSHEEIALEAIDAYKTVARLAVAVLGLGISQAKLTIHPDILAYIKAQTPPESGKSRPA